MVSSFETKSGATEASNDSSRNAMTSFRSLFSSQVSIFNEARMKETNSSGYLFSSFFLIDAFADASPATKPAISDPSLPNTTTLGMTATPMQ